MTVRQSSGRIGGARELSGSRCAFGLGMLICSLSLLAACSDSYEWNQRVTVVIDTPNGARSGFGTMNVRYSAGIPFIVGDARGGGFELRGEAPVVKLDDGRFVFALLTNMSRLASDVLSGGRGGISEYGDRIEAMQSPMTVPPKFYPTFVMVENPRDLRTA